MLCVHLINLLLQGILVFLMSIFQVHALIAKHGKESFGILSIPNYLPKEFLRKSEVFVTKNLHIHLFVGIIYSLLILKHQRRICG